MKTELATTRARRPARAEGQGLRLGEAAYQEIKRKIVSNEFAPNYQLTEGRLAELLGMSRTPVHEALVRLEKEGLIENIPRHGMRVLPISAHEMLEIYQVLTALESAAIELIVRRPDAADAVASLRKEIDAMDRASEAQDMAAWAAADARFHRKFFELCGNGHLMQIGLASREQVDRARMLTLPMRDTTIRSNQAHRELVRLMERGDAELAALSHKKHRERVTVELTEILRRFQGIGL
ncbi:GntR family transcriptional regulator [Pigmentiphaga soli]|uniref:GntR family transcriptional regulator n=1 Tax=Pigmentiphaga soli TaxID=1007095 RepID=A0ABP8GE49_9BURK